MAAHGIATAIPARTHYLYGVSSTTSQSLKLQAAAVVYQLTWVQLKRRFATCSTQNIGMKVKSHAKHAQMIFQTAKNVQTAQHVKNAQAVINWLTANAAPQNALEQQCK